MGPDGTPQVALTPRGTERWQAGHPWIYRADLNGDPAALGRRGGAGGGPPRLVPRQGLLLVDVEDRAALAVASRTSRSDPSFFRQRIAQADALRGALYPGETTYRVVHGEADLLPGLVVDRYGDYLSVQFLVPGDGAAKRAPRPTCWSRTSARAGS